MRILRKAARAAGDCAKRTMYTLFSLNSARLLIAESLKNEVSMQFKSAV